MSWLAELLSRNSSDPRERLELGQTLVAALQTQPLPPDSKLLNDLCDLIFQWLAGSNFKVSLLALEAMDVGATASGPVLVPYLIDRFSNIIDRLGDSKVMVREATADLIVALSYSPPCTPQLVLEKIVAAMAHRVWHVRCGGMHVFARIAALSRGEVETQVTRTIPTFCRLMADPNPELILKVRDSAGDALAQLMAAFGPDIVESIQKKKLLPDSKLEMLAAKCQEALKNSPVRQTRSIARPSALQKPQQRTPSAAPTPEPRSRKPSLQRSEEDLTRNRSMVQNRTIEPGEVTEEEIRSMFPCPPITMGPLADEMENIRVNLENDRIDWTKRFAAIQKLRAIAQLDIGKSDAFVTLLTNMAPEIVITVRDLRSQLVKEATATICYIWNTLGIRVVKLAEAVLPVALNHLKNSQNVFWSCGQLIATFIVDNVQSPSIISVITRDSSSKAKRVRQFVVVLIEKMLSWPPHLIQGPMEMFTKIIKAAITDADPATRKSAREAYLTLEMQMPDVARKLYTQLGPDGQKRLGTTGSKAPSLNGSQQSLNTAGLENGQGRRLGQLRFDKRLPNGSFGRSASALDPGALSSFRTGMSGVRMGPPARFADVKSRVYSPSPSSQPPSRSTSPSRGGAARFAVPNLPASKSIGRAAGAQIMRPQQSMNRLASMGRQKTSDDINNALLQLQLGFCQDDEAPGTPQRQTSALRKPSNQTSLRTPSNNINRPATFKSPPVDAVKSGHPHVIHLLSSADDPTKKEGLRGLAKLCEERLPLSKEELKQYCDALARITSASRQLITFVCDGICGLMAAYGRQMEATDLDYLIRQIFIRLADELLLPINIGKFQSALQGMMENVSPQLLLNLVCKKFQDSSLSVKPRLRMLEFLQQLLEMHAGVKFDINGPDVKGAVVMMLKLANDGKSGAKPRAVIESILHSLFAMSAPDFDAMLPQDTQQRQLAYALLKNEASTTNGAHSNGSGTIETASKVPSISSHTNTSGRSSAGSYNSMALDTSLSDVLSVISNKNHPDFVSKFKLLSEMIKSKPEDQLAELADKTGSYILMAINEEHSNVRKAGVIALVSLNIRAPERARLILNQLAPSKQKLVDVFTEKTKNGSTQL
ncbi:unnamed protein product, partial [Mesorhabditis spiculigera]